MKDEESSPSRPDEGEALRFRELIRHSSDIFAIVDASARLTYASEAFERFLGHSGSSIGRNSLEFVHPDDVEETRQAFAGIIKSNGQPKRQDLRLLRSDGSVRRFEVIANNLLDNPLVAGVVLNLRDITERKQAADLVAAQADILEKVASGHPLDETLNRICSISDYLEAGTTWSISIAGDGDDDDQLPPPAADRPATTWRFPITAAKGGEDLGMIRIHSTHPRSPDLGERRQVAMAAHLAAIAIERDRAALMLAHQANYDSLTGLPNRAQFLERLRTAIRRSGRQGGPAVLFVDLDDFKSVNDSFGHEAGDRLLVDLASRLHDSLRPSDTVARFGGDEFVVLCEDLPGASYLSDVATRLISAVAAPFQLDQGEVFLSASIGISRIEHPDDEAEDLIRNADSAMYRAKAMGRSQFVVFDEELRSQAVERMALKNAMHRAHERRELRLHHQPMFWLPDLELRGFEALLRWDHPQRGLLLPGDFLPMAEASGLIVTLGNWALLEACRRAGEWGRAASSCDGAAKPVIAVNFSARQLVQPNLLNVVAEAIADGGLEGELHLEITESVIMEDFDTVLAVMKGLSNLGVKVWIDDFGTGYSSLSYLRRLPVDGVKIDHSFVQGLGSDPGDLAIVNTILTLSRSLGLTVVAEGVEREDQLETLCELGCDAAQGFLLARPAPQLHGLSSGT